ncbi:hypothetical protein DRX19_15100 [Salmonella enterica subsp. enterica]|nr:hypothetical protein [Salmonella enterica subsp. enterica serovar Pensacola]
MKPDSLIHLHVSAATKGRWIRASRAAGMRLTEWVIDAVEAHIQQKIARLAIPDDLDFSDLHLVRESDGSVSFDWDVVNRICKLSNLPVEIFRDVSEDCISALIVGWYQAHRQHGGESDPVAEDLIAEVVAEEKAGQTVSHHSGRA